MMKRKTVRKVCLVALMLALLAGALCVTAFAAPSDVASALESTWTGAKEQIKNVVNKVVFPALDLILAVLFFVKLGASYFDYKKHGQFEITAPAILFAGLLLIATAPLYIWQIIG
jgi:hypothetical protein